MNSALREQLERLVLEYASVQLNTEVTDVSKVPSQIRVKWLRAIIGAANRLDKSIVQYTR